MLTAARLEADMPIGAIVVWYEGDLLSLLVDLRRRESLSEILDSVKNSWLGMY